MPGVQKRTDMTPIMIVPVGMWGGVADSTRREIIYASDTLKSHDTMMVLGALGKNLSLQ
jgi:hypothetical protein